MECERCVELELAHAKRTEEFISLVERQSRLARNGEAQAAGDLDLAISVAKAAMHESLRAWHEHRDLHRPAIPD